MSTLPSNPKLPPEAPRMTPTEADRLIEWHQMAAQVSEQTDDFAGARWHREKLAAWRAWRGVARASDETCGVQRSIDRNTAYERDIKVLEELLVTARAELPDPDFVPTEEQETRVRSIRDRIDKYVAGDALKASDDIRRPTGQCNWGCYYSANGRLIRDSDCTVHGASSENGGAGGYCRRCATQHRRTFCPDCGLKLIPVDVNTPKANELQCIYRTGCQSLEACKSAEHCQAPMADALRAQALTATPERADEHRPVDCFCTKEAKEVIG